MLDVGGAVAATIREVCLFVFVFVAMIDSVSSSGTNQQTQRSRNKPAL